MSEMFCFHPEGAETIGAFNERLAQFCQANVVADIAISVGPGLAISLSLMEPEDLPIPAAAAILPVLALIEPTVVRNLEAHLTQLCDELEAAAPQDEDFVIAQTRIHPMASDPNRGYAVIIVNLGPIEYADDKAAFNG